MDSLFRMNVVFSDYDCKRFVFANQGGNSDFRIQRNPKSLFPACRKYYYSLEWWFTHSFSRRISQEMNRSDQICLFILISNEYGRLLCDVGMMIGIAIWGESEEYKINASVCLSFFSLAVCLSLISSTNTHDYKTLSSRWKGSLARKAGRSPRRQGFGKRV